MSTFLDQWISENLLSAMGWTLIHSVWQMLLISGLLWVSLKVFSKKSPATKYMMAYASMALCLLVVVGTFIYQINTQVTVADVTAFSGAVEISPSMLGLEALEETSSRWASVVNFLEPQIPYLVNIWFFGALLFMVRLFGNLAAIRNLRMSSHTNIEFGVEKTFYRLMGKMDLPNSVELRLTNMGTSPMTFGFLKPIVLLPAGLIFHLSPVQLEAIFAHELAHIKRNDYLANMIQSILEVVFFYHPSFWWISQTIKELRENAADDLAIQSGVKPDVLAHSLAEVLNFAQEQSADLALAASKKRNPTLQRIKRILGQPAQTYPQNPIISLPMILTLFITLGLVATAAQDAPDPANEVEPLVALTVPELSIPMEVASLPVTVSQSAPSVELASFTNAQPALAVVDTTEKKEVKKEIIIHTEVDHDTDVDNDADVNVFIEKEVDEDAGVLVWTDKENGTVFELKGGKNLQFDSNENIFIMDGDTISIHGPHNLKFDSMFLDMSDFPSFEMEGFPEFEVMLAPEFYIPDMEGMPEFDFDFEGPMVFEFDGDEEFTFWKMDTTEMTKAEQEAWVKDIERKAEEMAKKMEEKAKLWEEQMAPKMKEYELKMKEWQEQWEPKFKEYEAKLKEWEKEQEPKIKEFEEKVKAWQKENEPKMEEFQKQVEVWQKKNEEKIKQLQKEYEIAVEKAQKEKEKNN